MPKPMNDDSRRAAIIEDLRSRCSGWPDADVKPSYPGYRIWTGRHRVTGDPLWVVDYIELDGSVFNIAVTPDPEHVARFIRDTSLEDMSPEDN